MNTAPEIISLQEVADRLGVHYMTVYRYVRLGKLPATKAGGTWQVAVADLEDMQRGDDSPVQARPPADWSRRLHARLLEGDEPGSWGVVEGALASGMDPAEIYTDVLGPALVAVGERWHAGEISVATEHLASAVASRIIGRLGPRFLRKGRSRGRVIVTEPEGERHSMPAAMLADLLRGAGFDVTDLGADVPAEALEEVVERADSLVAVCISATRAGSDREIREAIESVRGASDALVLVGGAAIAGADHAAELGADGWAPDGSGAVRLVIERVAAKS